MHAYDHVGLPPVRAIVTRIDRRRGTCPRCQDHVAAPAPESFEPGCWLARGLPFTAARRR